MAAHALSSLACPTAKETISTSGCCFSIIWAILCPVSRASSILVPVGISTVIAISLLSDAGINSVLSVKALITTPNINMAKTVVTVVLLLVATFFTSREYPLSSLSSKGSTFLLYHLSNILIFLSLSALIIFALIIGVSVMAIISESEIMMVTIHPSCLNITPAKPPTIVIGKNTATMVSVDAMMESETSSVP
ncbi:hypothetical protein SDC9_62040 [bioreactor metagenome]|uniref:Uncharacterized protein n=1 Tax=bioreactor metagenome TaxID=1076179 RepID=A0A644XHV6_9ZZZZ